MSDQPRKVIKHSVHRKDFKIHQYVKLEGIKTKKTRQEFGRFSSPIFGTNVPDEVIIPEVDNSVLGDNGQRLDAFRDKPKISDEEKIKKTGTIYTEFDFVTNKHRTEYLGGKIIKPKEEVKVEEDLPKKIKPILPGQKQAIQVEIKEEVNNISTEKVEETIKLEPIVEVVEPKNGSFDIDDFVSTSNFEEVIEEVIERPKQIERKEKETNIPNKVYRQPKKYIKPNVNMFKTVDLDKDSKPEWLLENIRIIDEQLDFFKIPAKVSDSIKGPTVTRYELSLEPGVNVNRISSIENNIKLALSAIDIRILAPIPGKPYVGIEVPNNKSEIVPFGNVVNNKEFLSSNKPLLFALGININGDYMYEDIAKMPHGLIAGATNSGKSVAINTLLASLLIKNTPDDLKLILIDPKYVELTAYNDLPHLITPVVTDPRIASQTLKWSVEEMERRFILFANNKSKNIESFNEGIAYGRINHDKMPYLVIVIDELADLMQVASQDVEDSIQRLTQKARAAGIHLIVATQRPSVDVIKGTIKSNIPTRIAFKVASNVDSQTILDGSGAEKLLGKGDMLIKTVDHPNRLQGAYISDDEIYALTDFIKEQAEPKYLFMHEELNQKITSFEELDELFNDVARFVVMEQKTSINVVSKEFQIGFNRAQSIVKSLVQSGIISEGEGTRSGTVLVSLAELEEILDDVKF